MARTERLYCRGGGSGWACDGKGRIWARTQRLYCRGGGSGWACDEKAEFGRAHRGCTVGVVGLGGRVHEKAEFGRANYPCTNTTSAQILYPKCCGVLRRLVDRFFVDKREGAIFYIVGWAG